MAGEWVFRLAVPSDAESFAKWASENPQVDAEDLLAGTKTKNPTALMFAAEKDGVVVAFGPVYMMAMLSHLGFNPDAEDKDKLRALQIMIDGVSAFAVQYGIREIGTLSKKQYPIARWAVKHGFEEDERQVFRLKLNEILETTGVT